MSVTSTEPFNAQGHVLIAELTRLLRQAGDRDQALTGALELLFDRTAASVGLVWRRDLAGQWQLLATYGDPPVIDAVLRRHPEPISEPAGVAVERREPGSAVIRVPAPTGEPAAVMLLAGMSDQWTRPQRSGLFEAVTGVLEHGWWSLTQQWHFEQAQQAAGVGSWQWRSDTNEVWLSEQMYRNLGISPAQFEHTLDGYLDRVHPDDRDELARQVEVAMTRGGDWHTVHRVVTDTGEVRCLEGHGQVVLDEHGTAACLAGVGQDITRRRALEQELAERAARDELTGLANRHAFQQALQQAIEEQPPHGPRGLVAVALVDIDGFRTVNELHGWAAGDALLRQVADRLRRVPKASLVARLAADEFALLFVDPDGRGRLASLAEEISMRVHEPDPPRVEGHRTEVGVGIASNLDDGQLSEQLLRSASVALQVAKTRTNARWQVFDPDKHEQALQRLAMEADLRSAIERDAIELVYQPIVAARSGEITGVEALARWDRPGHGPVPPATFIPIAERIGLMPLLGDQVLGRACRQLRTWEQTCPGARQLRVTVNLSALQLDEPLLVETVQDVLARHQLAPDRLVLEVTESTISQDIPGALARLFELRRRGIRIAIDDFGTGYSSLARLREIPFDILKIDRSFVKDLASRHEPTPILQALFSISRSLDLDVVAEGVETPVQLAVMLGHDCPLLQGYLFSRPLEPAGLEALLESGHTWDTTGIAGQVPLPRTSIRLQHLLDQLTAVGEPDPEVLDEILTILAGLTGLDSVYLTRIDFREDVQEILAARNLAALRIEPGLKVPWTDTLCRRALAQGHPVIHDVQREHPDAHVARDLDIGTYVGVEVHGPKGGLRGTLCGATTDVTDIPQETIETLQWVARLLADPVQYAPTDSPG